MRRAIKAAVSVCVVSLLVLSQFPVSAITAGDMVLSEKNFRPYFDFDSVPEVYTVNYKPGMPTDRIGLSKNKKAISGSNCGIVFDLTITKGNGISGNALQLNVTGGPGGGAWSPLDLKMQNSKNAKKYSYEGATDFMFWVDLTKFKNTKTNTYFNKGIIFTIQEVDCDASGKLLNTTTGWATKCAEDGGYYLMENGKGGWDKVPTCNRKDGDNNMRFPKNYKGWIRIPLKNFRLCNWNNNKDVDGKFDAKVIEYVSFGMGYDDTENNSSMVIDQVGFYGNFKTTPPASSNKPLSTVPGSSAKPSSAVSAASSSGSSSASSSVSAAGASSEESSGTNVSSSSDISSVVPTNNEGSNSSGPNIPLIIGIAVAAAVVIGAGIFIFIKVRKAH